MAFKRNWLFWIDAILAIFLWSCGGGNNQSATQLLTPLEKGKQIYSKTCATCHQSNGMGLSGTFPPLAKSDFLATGKEKAIAQVIKGRTGELIVNGVLYNNIMPPQGLNDEEVSEVLNYVYSNFGNSGEKTSPEEVRAARETLK